uniref:Master replication protein n=1 Tax=Parsley severe stunt associated virus TaxID=2558055 RepID=A0A6G7BND0_9VIRU|nr:master replication initiator protein [Parsley severe stunt associated virus]
MAKQVICWCFTINNPKEHLIFSEDKMKYLVYQLEEGEQGTRHFQGYVEMIKRSSLKQMSKLFPDAHLEKRRGTQTEARNYAMKEESRIEGPWEHGTFVMRIEDKLKEVIDDMRITLKRPSEYMEGCENTIDKSFETLSFYYAEFKKTKVVENWEFPEQPWEMRVRALMEEGDPRVIIWVYGSNGGEGKTCFAKKLIKEYDAFYSVGGKATDIAYLYNYESIVLFDIPRDKEEYVAYGLIEQFKNGIVQSTKSKPFVKFVDPPCVIVFANFTPRSGMLSEDRIVIVDCADWK